MNVTHTAESLIAFEEDIRKAFENKEIRAPVHADNGNEEALMHIFRNNVNEDDWCLCSWRSHYKAILKGIPTEDIKKEILAGHSISLCFPKYRFLSSAIVGGVCSIAVGIGMAIKRSGEAHKRKAVAFLGDMTSVTGAAYEAMLYAKAFALPVLWVIEDNGKSVCTDTKKVWNFRYLPHEPPELTHNYFSKHIGNGPIRLDDNVIYYRYTSKWPHAGFGSRITF